MGKTVRSSFQYLSISYECSLAIGNSLNLSEMLYEVIHTVVHKTNAHRGIIWVKNGDKKLQPVASAGINIENMPAQSEIMDLRDVLNQIQKKQQFVLRYKEDNDFLQYCPVLTGKEESVLIVPVTNIAILYLVYASREITDEPLANLLASLSKKLSVAIEACTAHGNVIKEIQVREKAEKELTKKTEQLISSKKNIQRLYGESEQARKLLLSILEDVAQKEEALRNSEEKLIQAVEGNSIPTFIIDTNHFITHWNKACESLTGFSASEVVSTKKQWLAFYHEERPVMADFIVDMATEEEMAKRYKNISYNKSVLIEGAYEGENFYPDLGEKGKWLFFTAAPLIDQNRKIVGAIETLQDITERRGMEKQLRQSQKMEAIGTLAAGIAHDFNNLLTVIIGNAQLALMNVIKDESLREGIEEIEETGKKAASLTQQLLAFSRKQIIKPEVVDINKGINETKKMLKHMIGEDLEFQTLLEPELWKVYADPGQINQIIMNLVVNSRDAMPQGGRLTIETVNADLNENCFRERSIEGEKTGPYVMLAVSDTGIGMDKKTQEHIFEPFFTTKEVGKGTGLGLPTVYGIVKQSKGFIWVYSEPGQGTTFKIYLPKVKGDAEPEKKEKKPVTKLAGSETVLIVEDDDGLRKFAQEVLLLHGYRVLDAENGEDALRVSQAHEGQIDLTITDVVMPKMGGKELTERLQPLYPQMKVIYMSGYTDNAIVHHGVLMSGLNFLEKPFSPEGLARKAREVLDAGKK